MGGTQSIFYMVELARFMVYSLSFRKSSHEERKKELEVPMEAAMPCKMETRKRARKPQETVASESTDSRKKKYACIVEAHESTRKRLESTLPRNHEDHITDKEFNSTRYSLLHKFIPMPQAMKIPDAVDKECEKLEKMPAWQLNKVRSKKDGILEAQKEKRKVHLVKLI